MCPNNCGCGSNRYWDEAAKLRRQLSEAQLKIEALEKVLEITQSFNEHLFGTARFIANETCDEERELDSMMSTIESLQEIIAAALWKAAH